ncbi:MAG: hypothetical protein AAF389_16740 [Gemmatimonadota bacterium]
MTRILHDPTSERSPLLRPRVAPPETLEGKTVALFDLGKIRSDEFLDALEVQFIARGIEVVRAAKPTNAKPASPDIIQDVAHKAHVIVEAVAD